MTPKWLLSRRTLIRGGAGVAISLPLLDVMVPPKAHAQMGVANKRFIVYYTPGGTVMDAWQPSGSETNFTLPEILKPLEKHKTNLTVLSGLDLKVTEEGFGHPHSRGMGALLTGQPLNSGPYETCGGNAEFANGQSIDQAIATKISAGKKFKSLELAVRWPTDTRDGGKAAPTNNLNLSGPNQPVPMSADPQAVFARLFAGVGEDKGLVSQDKLRTKSILAAVGKEYQNLLPKVSKSDRAKLDEHFTRIKEIETSLDALSEANASCVKPAIGGSYDHQSDSQIPKTGQLMMDMMVMAFACDLTNVATMQWTDSQAYNTFPWLNFNENHHAYQHDKGYQPEALKKIYNWYATQVASLVDRLAAVQEQGQSLLQNAAMLWGSEISHPDSHGQQNMPFAVIGTAGGSIRGGRWLKYNGLPHNNLLLSLGNAYGLNLTTFGRAKYCTGLLAGFAA